MANMVQRRELALAKAIGRHVDPRVRYELVADFLDSLDALGEREWGNQIADEIDRHGKGGKWRKLYKEYT